MVLNNKQFPTHGHVNIGRQAKAYVHNLCHSMQSRRPEKSDGQFEQLAIYIYIYIYIERERERERKRKRERERGKQSDQNDERMMWFPYK